MEDQGTNRTGGGLIPRFSLGDLAISATLIAIGVVSVTYVVRGEHQTAGPAVLLAAWIGGGALIGAGIFHLILRWWVGVVLGVFVQWIIAVINLANSNL
jgi:hypothetical protein